MASTHPANLKRASWASSALDAFYQAAEGRAADLEHRDDRRDAMTDLICDLLHLAALEGADPLTLASVALEHFKHESAADYAGD